MERVKDPKTNRENGRDAPEWVDGAAKDNQKYFRECKVKLFQTKLQAFQ